MTCDVTRTVPDDQHCCVHVRAASQQKHVTRYWCWCFLLSDSRFRTRCRDFLGCKEEADWNTFGADLNCMDAEPFVRVFLLCLESEVSLLSSAQLPPRRRCSCFPVLVSRRKALEGSHATVYQQWDGVGWGGMVGPLAVVASVWHSVVPHADPESLALHFLSAEVCCVCFYRSRSFVQYTQTTGGAGVAWKAPGLRPERRGRGARSHAQRQGGRRRCLDLG